MLIGILSQIVEFRNGESGPACDPYQSDHTAFAGTTGEKDRKISALMGR